ncbi:hypothetical protein JOC76_005176 [Neobacillus cucumis]|nr:hypothetical protein [Neobacillus cucumis]
MKTLFLYNKDIKRGKQKWIKEFNRMKEIIFSKLIRDNLILKQKKIIF